jgi:hypothetical protein
MWKINLWIIIIAVVAIAIGGKMKLSKRYERDDKRIKDISPWKALDRGVDPTDNEEKQ